MVSTKRRIREKMRIITCHPEPKPQREPKKTSGPATSGSEVGSLAPRTSASVVQQASNYNTTSQSAFLKIIRVKSH
jgi:hypothetical protein